MRWAFILILLLIGCNTENSIKKEIDLANYCTTRNDCVDVGGKCPFGCYIYVNENEADRIAGLVGSFDSVCVYGCLECKDFSCHNGRCEPVCS